MFTECPVDPALSEFVAGELPPDESTLVSAHVRSCPRCSSRVRVLECALPATNPLLGELRAAPPPEVPSDPEFQAAVRNLLSFPAGRGPGIGDVIDDYQLVEVLGEGGMGVVYRAVHTRLEKEVALKVIRRAGAIHPQTADRFRREMRAAGKLRHENLVQATDAGVADGLQYLVMEFVPGVNLARLVGTHGPLPLTRACDIVRQAALGLHHAHEHGLVHRDVKPSNLLLGTDGVVRVLDVGLALLPGELPLETVPPADEVPPTNATDDTLTSPGQQLGTRHYTAPEQLADSHRVDHRADVYSLGCTLSFLLTGHNPAMGNPYPPHLPRELWERFLAVRPTDRFPSMLAVAESLAPYCVAQPNKAPPPAEPSRARRWWIASGTVVALAAVVAVAMILVRQPAPTVAPEPPALAEAPPPRAIPPRGALPMTPAEARALQTRWAEHIGQPAAVKNSLGMELVLIPPGEFGISATYSVTLTRPYRIGTLEVTRAQFQQFLSANPEFVSDAEAKHATGMYLHFLPPQVPPASRAPYHFRNPGWGAYLGDQPITYLTWNDAERFLAWLSVKEGRTYRLPTHAEWVWACRAGSAAKFSWRDDERIAEYAFTGLERPAPDRPQPVGRLKPNAWGLHDTFGNVSEMVQDYFSPVPLVGHATDPAGPATGSQRTICGGSYTSKVEFAFGNVPWASDAQTNLAYSSTGFRVVLEP